MYETSGYSTFLPIFSAEETEYISTQNTNSNEAIFLGLPYAYATIYIVSFNPKNNFVIYNCSYFTHKKTEAHMD